MVNRATETPHVNHVHQSTNTDGAMLLTVVQRRRAARETEARHRTSASQAVSTRGQDARSRASLLVREHNAQQNALNAQTMPETDVFDDYEIMSALARRAMLMEQVSDSDDFELPHMQSQ